MGTQVIAGFLKDSVRSVSREPPGCCYSPARIELATRAVLGLEREKFPDLAAKVESALMNEKRRVHSQFEVPLVLTQLAHFTEEHTNLRRQRPAELIEILVLMVRTRNKAKKMTITYALNVVRDLLVRGGLDCVNGLLLALFAIRTPSYYCAH